MAGWELGLVDNGDGGGGGFPSAPISTIAVVLGQFLPRWTRQSMQQVDGRLEDGEPCLGWHLGRISASLVRQKNTFNSTVIYLKNRK